MSATPSQAQDFKLYSDGRFVIADYNRKRPFSNFLPGISGLYGKPMWLFYTNRGQGVASFGTRNKDGAILEFFPANKAYQMTPGSGFRTFIKFLKPNRAACYEPFREDAIAPHRESITQTMEIRSEEFSVRESNRHLGIETAARYFTVPGEPLATLARELVITNTGSSAVEIEVLDGLPSVNPFGMNEFFTKNMSRTIEAWMVTDNLARRAPYFRLKVDATDRPEVTPIKEGNFYFAFSSEGSGQGKALDVIVDPALIFDSMLDFSQPKLFLPPGPFKMPKGQISENRTPCAFSFARLKIAPGRSRRIVSYLGKADTVETLNRFVSRASAGKYFETKRSENRALIESIKAPIFSVTASQVYDLYCGQTYLDNVLRGGMPIFLGGGEDPLVFYVYSRKHGDLERDYNQFVLEPTVFSQGNGNFRDVNQNRRSDVWFFPEVKEANIRTFYELIQPDGFNPLVIKGARFHFKKTAESRRALGRFIKGKHLGLVAEFLEKSFNPGELYAFLDERGLATKAGFAKLLEALRPYISREEQADHGEGFWVDHWTYSIDLVESYLAIYPERTRELLFKQGVYGFYDSDHFVRPRSERLVLKGGAVIRQFGSVIKDKDKAKLIASRKSVPNLVRTRHGHGDIYRTSLFIKMLSLFTNKFASLDPFGIGIEMEADKPSWYDALNGLPGLLGSSLPETFELKRLGLFMLQMLEETGRGLQESETMPVELHEFVTKLSKLVDTHLTDRSEEKHFRFWDASSTLKEKYRLSVRYGFSGRERAMRVAELKSFLEHAREKIDAGLERGFDAKAGRIPTYFENHLYAYRMSKTSHGADLVKPVRFKQEALPLFLEGPVHAIKVEKDPARRRQILKAVRESKLFDQKLGMYKVTAPLRDASLEIGRATVFAPGWLENESIWLHMEYKLLLELLKGGLSEEFYRDFRRVLVPFQPADRYGRSVLENSSFIVSSAFVDESLHGGGFVARLSGSTAEFLHMWLLMNVGKRPFLLGPDGKLSLRFEPQLAEFLFTKEETTRQYFDARGELQTVKVPKNAVAFLFLGKTLVVYHNHKRLDTFGKLRVSVKKTTLTTARGQKIEFKSDTIPAPYAGRVRDEFVPRIDIELG